MTHSWRSLRSFFAQMEYHSIGMGIASGEYCANCGVLRCITYISMSRCFPHCINIATQTVMDELKTNPVEPVLTTSTDPSDLPHLMRYAAALEADPVGKTRDLVTTCRSSGQRRHELQSVITEGNDSGRWQGEEGRKIPPVQLLQDCKTRWSSTFLLIDRVLMLYPVSPFPIACLNITTYMRCGPISLRVSKHF